MALCSLPPGIPEAADGRLRIIPVLCYSLTPASHHPAAPLAVNPPANPSFPPRWADRSVGLGTVPAGSLPCCRTSLERRFLPDPIRHAELESLHRTVSSVPRRGCLQQRNPAPRSPV